MGISTDLMQQMNRTFTSQKAEKDFRKKQKADFENYLYNRIYSKFYQEKDFDPKITYSYFINTDKKSEILQDFQDVDIITKNNIYNKILNRIYKDFKNDFDANKSTDNIKKQEIQLMKEYLKLEEKHQKILKEKQKQEEIYQQLLEQQKKIKKQGISKIFAGLFIGGRVASKTYKKMKY